MENVHRICRNYPKMFTGKQAILPVRSIERLHSTILPQQYKAGNAKFSTCKCCLNRKRQDFQNRLLFESAASLRHCGPVSATAPLSVVALTEGGDAMAYGV
ncbi:MAG: hypothetical protein LBH60_06530 [Prevotellaceae bacterium]|nr:hypothetical protein [Prevotellaceae bacterium]